MALKKNHTTHTGIPLTVFRVMSGRMDPLTKEASFIVSGYVSDTVPKDFPTVPVFAKVRLQGEAYDRYLSKAAMAGADEDVYGLLYRAMKYSKGCVVCDAGENFFADAEDV